MEEVCRGLMFPEGPIAMDDGSVILVEIERKTLSRVSADGKISVVAECGGGPNGAAVGPHGRVYICNNGGFTWMQQGPFRRPGETLSPDYVGGSIQAVEIKTGTVETIYTECNGESLKGPNDIVFDAHGGFYFTDLGKRRGRMLDRGSVFYADRTAAASRKSSIRSTRPMASVSRRMNRRCMSQKHSARVSGRLTSNPRQARPTGTSVLPRPAVVQVRWL